MADHSEHQQRSPEQVSRDVLSDAHCDMPTFLALADSQDKVDGSEALDGQSSALETALVEMNEKHAVIGNFGGKCVVVEEFYNDASGRTVLSAQDWAAIGHRYANKFVEYEVDGKTKKEPLARWWKRHPERRQYDRVDFVPGRQLPPEIFNLWRGFGVEAAPGNCDLFLAHVRDNVCVGDEALYQYVMSWLARLVQKLDRPAETALVLRGRMGTGKNVFADTIGRLFGQHYVPISDGDHLVGRFNAHMRDAKLVCADEAFYAGDRHHRSVLKSLVTSKTKMQEAKFVDGEVVGNFIGLIMLSNEDWVVPAGLEERRFVVLDVSDAHTQDHPYFAAIEKQMENGGYEGLLHTLLAWDLKGFEVRTIPQTTGLRDQKQLSFSPLQQWWHEKLERGAIFPQHADWQTRIYCPELIEDFRMFERRASIRRGVSTVAIGKFLKGAIPGLGRGHTHDTVSLIVDGRETRVERPRVYLLPTLEECRAHWDTQGGPWAWPDDDGPDGVSEADG